VNCFLVFGVTASDLSNGRKTCAAASGFEGGDFAPSLRRVLSSAALVVRHASLYSRQNIPATHPVKSPKLSGEGSGFKERGP